MTTISGSSFSALLAASLLLSAAAPEQAAPKPAAEPTGSVKGSVKIKGPIPPRRKLRVDNEPN